MAARDRACGQRCRVLFQAYNEGGSVCRANERECWVVRAWDVLVFADGSLGATADTSGTTGAFALHSRHHVETGGTVGAGHRFAW